MSYITHNGKNVQVDDLFEQATYRQRARKLYEAVRAPVIGTAHLDNGPYTYTIRVRQGGRMTIQDQHGEPHEFVELMPNVTSQSQAMETFYDAISGQVRNDQDLAHILNSRSDVIGTEWDAGRVGNRGRQSV